MFVFAGLSPHPPIIVPEVGRGEMEKVKKTVKAMREWAGAVREARPDSLVFISPHGCFLRDAMGYLGEREMRGSFAGFGAPQVSFRVAGNLSLAAVVAGEAAREGVAFIPGDYYGPGDEARRGLRLNFTYPRETEITEGVKRLAAAVRRLRKEEPAPAEERPELSGPVV